MFSHARAFLLASCHILLLSSCLEVSLSQAGRVELLWVLPAFARCSFGVGSWQAWQPIPTGPLSCDSTLPAGSLKHPFIPLYKWRHGTGFHFFWPICMQLQKQRSPIPPPHSLTDFLNRIGRLTLVASKFWFVVTSCCGVFHHLTATSLYFHCVEGVPHKPGDSVCVCAYVYTHLTFFNMTIS